MSSNVETSEAVVAEAIEQDIAPSQEPSLAESTAVAAAGSPELDMILNIPVELSLEVGRTRQTVEQVLALAKGSVIELNRKAGEPLDVKVNGTLIAHAEVVESNGKYGIRILDVITGNNQPGKLL